ncbi:amino acid adenylation domain-containing protein [Micromonospora sp. NPDC049051]|uniref:non-ribosomal peptide synthetase n=1 Tax=Micromonospora sp. NPDC049051 TaxID=3364264 RepID=UPI00370FC765
MAAPGLFRAAPWQRWLVSHLPDPASWHGTAEVRLPVAVARAEEVVHALRERHPLARTRLVGDDRHGAALQILDGPADPAASVCFEVHAEPDGGSRVLIRVPGTLADAGTLRMLQSALVDEAAGRPADPAGLDSLLRYAQWQHNLQRQAPEPLPARGPVNAVPFERPVTGTASAEGLLGHVATGAARDGLREAAELLDVTAEAVLLGCWWLLLRAIADGEPDQLWVGVDERRAPVPDTVVGPLTGYRPWPVGLAGDAAVRDVLLAADRWLAGPALRRPVWHEASEPDALPAYAFTTAPAHAAVTVPGGEAVLSPPAPPPFARTLMLAPAVGAQRVDLLLRHAPDRIHRDDAVQLLDTLDGLLADLPTLVRAGRPWRGAAPVGTDAAATPVDPPSFWRRIQQQAARTPQAPAVGTGDEWLTYAELVHAARRLAGELRWRGARPDECVGVLAADGPGLVVSLLGVHAAGLAYVPLHHRLPAGRIAQMLATAGARLVVHDGSAPQLLPADVQVVDPTAGADPTPTGPADPPGGGPESLAYVMFTSGSTGTPKGVMVTRRGLDNYLDVAAREYPLAAGAGVVSHTAVIFDLSVTSLLAPLLVGQRVVVTDADEGIDGLLAAIRAVGDVSLLKLTPAHLALLSRLDLAGYGRVRAVVLGGEDLPTDVVARWRANHPDCLVFNEYGPTETVVGCTVWSPDPADAGYRSVPIGRPIQGARVLVCGPDHRPLVAGVPGEICVAGAGVARGYLGDPRRTAAQFVPDPTGEPGARMYRTGDLGTATAACGLLFHGRIDRQVKLHGFRIEPAEIELRLRELPGVTDAVAHVGTLPGGERVLVGYLVADREVGTGADTALLHAALPWYMVPTMLRRLPALPTAANGKVDLRQLPPPVAAPTTGGGAVTEMQRLVREAWSEVTGVAEPDLDTRFFEVGGTSYSLVKVNARLRERLRREISIADMFERPTIRQLAAFLEEEPPAAPDTPEHPTGNVSPEPTADRRQEALRRLRARRGEG